MRATHFAPRSSFVVLITIASACGAHDDSGPADPFAGGGSANVSGTGGGSASGNSAGATGGSASSTSNATGLDAGVVAVDAGAPNPKCALESPDQQGCPCNVAGTKRGCYPGSAATRHVGACGDGFQACTSKGSGSEIEQYAYGPCEGMTMPGSKACSVELDAFCTGLVGCADPLCASQAICTPDAGTPDSGPPDNPCITVTGQNGNISVNGTMFCENDGLGGLGGLGGGLLGGLFGGP